MQSLTITKPKSLVSRGPGAPLINKAYAEFCESTAFKALVIGQMLREQRDVVCPSAHNQHTPDDAQWSSWMRDNCDIPERTARRWMEMAERVCVQALAKFLSKEAIERGYIDIESTVSFSQAMTMPVKELPPAAQEARQLLFDFVADKTMKECMAKVMMGDSEASAVTRAHNGKNSKNAGGGYDPKQYALFVAQNIIPLQANVLACHKLREKLPKQWSEIESHLRVMIEGGSLPTKDAKIKVDVKGWPRDLCELVADILKERIKRKEVG